MHGYALRFRRRSTGSALHAMQGFTAPLQQPPVTAPSPTCQAARSLRPVSPGQGTPPSTANPAGRRPRPGPPMPCTGRAPAEDPLGQQQRLAGAGRRGDEGQRARSAPLEGIQEFQPVHEPRRREGLHACPRDRRRSWRLPAWDGKRTPTEPAPPYRSTGAGGHPKRVIPLVCPGCVVRPAAPPAEIADPSRPPAHHLRVWRSAARRRLLRHCALAAVPESANGMRLTQVG
jgi:hypothetical protein